MLGTLVRLGSEGGVWVGVLLCLCACSLFASISRPEVSLLIFPLMLGFAPLEVWLMRKVALRNPAFRSLSPLWLYGIVTFISGALIAALFSAVYMIYISPGFINRYFEFSLDILSQSTDAGMKAQYEAMKDAGGTLPSTMEFVSSMFWSVAFCGSLFSLILAAILPRTRLIYPKSFFKD